MPALSKVLGWIQALEAAIFGSGAASGMAVALQGSSAACRKAWSSTVRGRPVEDMVDGSVMR
jgi:hypothetical protein